MHQYESILDLDFWTKGGCCLGVWSTSWDSGEELFGDCTRRLIGYLGKEAKVGKGMDTGNLGRNVCGEISFLEHMHMHSTNEHHPAQLERE